MGIRAPGRNRRAPRAPRERNPPAHPHSPTPTEWRRGASRQSPGIRPRLFASRHRAAPNPYHECPALCPRGSECCSPRREKHRRPRRWRQYRAPRSRAPPFQLPESTRRPRKGHPCGPASALHRHARPRRRWKRENSRAPRCSSRFPKMFLRAPAAALARCAAQQKLCNSFSVVSHPEDSR